MVRIITGYQTLLAVVICNYSRRSFHGHFDEVTVMILETKPHYGTGHNGPLIGNHIG